MKGLLAILFVGLLPALALANRNDQIPAFHGPGKIESRITGH